MNDDLIFKAEKRRHGKLSETVNPMLNEALSHYQNKDFEAAENACRLALIENQNDAQAHQLMGVLWSQKGDYEAATEHLEKAVALDSNLTEALFNLGKVHRDMGRYAKAITSFESVASTWPTNPDAWMELGVALTKSGRMLDSITAYEHAIEYGKSGYQVWYMLGTAYIEHGRYDHANAALRHALELDRSYAPTWVNLAITLENQGQLDEAIKLYRFLLNSEPNYHDALYRYALALLTTENLAAGWAAFAPRQSWPQTLTSHGQSDAPYWSGEDISNGSLLIWTEQGPGDEILMGSMVPDVLALNTKVTLACSDRIAPLFTRSFPNCRVVIRSKTELPADEIGTVSAQASLTELGASLRSTSESFSKSKAYLAIEHERCEALRLKYASTNGRRPLIGISWRSESETATQQKSTALKDWAEILKSTDADFVCLQYGDTEQERSCFQPQVGRELIWDPDIDPLKDMDGFAHQVGAMDLVISTSNTTVHVAGALGRDVWTLVPEGTGRPWYWFLDRTDCVWYPSMRLYRQPKAGDWATPLSAVHHDLSHWMLHWSAR